MDEFLDFALWQTTRQLEPMWMASLKSNPDFFGDPAKTAYALKSAASPEAIALLTQLYKEGQVPGQYSQDALSAIAKRGQIQDLNDILDVAIAGFSTEKRSEEHTSELQSLMRISYAVFCLKKKKQKKSPNKTNHIYKHFTT